MLKESKAPEKPLTLDLKCKAVYYRYDTFGTEKERGSRSFVCRRDIFMKTLSEKDRIMEKISPVAESLGLELIDVETERAGDRSILRLIADRRGGITLDELTELSELADPIIEFDLKIDQYDSFEVSSPGLDRPLKSMADFIRYEGEVVIVKLYAAIDGEKEFVGPLVFTEDEVGIEQDGKKIMFPLAKVAHIKREVVF